MTFYAIIAIILAVAAAVALVWAVWQPRLTVGAHLRRIDHYGYGASTPVVVETPRESPLAAFKRLVDRFSPADWEEKLREEFVRAGDYSATPEKMLVFRFGVPLVVTVLGVFMLVADPAPLKLALVAVSVVLAYKMPGIILARRIKARADRIEREIPDFIELLAITVEAGLSFDAAAQNTIVRMSGPIREEFGLMLQEVRMGVAREEAIAHVTERVDSRNLHTFARSLNQGAALGVPLGQILRNLSTDMRIRRKQMADERVQKTPLKIIMAAFFFIFPALLVVLMGPAGFRMYDVFVNHH
jgi:tight adherence protein C